MKTCGNCKIEKPLGEFAFKNKSLGKINAWCKVCNRDYQRKHYRANKQTYADKARQWELAQGGRRMIRYGLTQDAFDAMVAKYDGKCWICRTESAVVVDHDHACCPSKERTCGKCVRGVLCKDCNTGIGLLNDNLTTIRNALEYLGTMR